jgi:hypothetical protein
MNIKKPTICPLCNQKIKMFQETMPSIKGAIHSSCFTKLIQDIKNQGYQGAYLEIMLKKIL